MPLLDRLLALLEVMSENVVIRVGVILGALLLSLHYLFHSL